MEKKAHTAKQMEQFGEVTLGVLIKLGKSQMLFLVFPSKCIYLNVKQTPEHGKSE